MAKITITATDVNAIDYCIKTSLSILNCLNLGDIKKLMSSTNSFDCVLLSKISVLNVETIKLIDNSIETMSDNYVEQMKQNILDINNYTLSSTIVDSYRSIIDSVTLSALQYMDQLQLTYDLSSEDIGVTSVVSATEQNLQSQEGSSIDIFNFIESKNLLNNTLSTLKYDSDKLVELINSEATTYITFIGNSQDIINKYCNLLQDTINIETQAQQMIDACRLAIYIRNIVCDASQEKLTIFLNRKYQNIKQDVVLLLA